MHRWLKTVAVLTVLCTGVNGYCFNQCLLTSGIRTSSTPSEVTAANPPDTSCHHDPDPGQKHEKSSCSHDQFVTADLQKSLSVAFDAGSHLAEAGLPAVISLALLATGSAYQLNLPQPVSAIRSSISVLRI